MIAVEIRRRKVLLDSKVLMEAIRVGVSACVNPAGRAQTVHSHRIKTPTHVLYMVVYDARKELGIQAHQEQDQTANQTALWGLAPA
jgi:hypothetical protein